MKKQLLLFLLATLTIFSSCITLPALSQGRQADAYSGTATGTNTYAVTIKAITDAAIYDNQLIWFRTANANTTASTIQVTVAGNVSYAAIEITNNGSSLVAGDIVANQWYQLKYSLALNKWQIQKSASDPLLTSTYIGFGSSLNKLSGNSTLTWNNTNKALQLTNTSTGGSETVAFTDGSTRSAGFSNYGSAMGTNFLGTSVSQNGVFNVSNLGWDITYRPVYNIAKPFYISSGINSGDKALRMDDVGLKITTNASLHTTAAAAFDLTGTFRFIDGNPIVSGKVLTSDGSGFATWQTLASGWGILGNAATVDGTNFIGTTDNIPLSFRVNNIRAGRIESDPMSANTFYGYEAGKLNSAGSSNQAFGYDALQSNINGNSNVAFGVNALKLSTSNGNTGIGTSALNGNLTGINNTALGNSAGTINTVGSNNTLLGTISNVRYNNLTNATALGYNSKISISNAVSIGDTSLSTKVGIGTTIPTATMDIRGTFRLVDGNQVNGKILTTDGSGNGTWQVNAGSTLTSTQIGFGNGSNLLSGSSNLTFNNNSSYMPLAIINTSSTGYTTTSIYNDDHVFEMGVFGTTYVGNLWGTNIAGANAASIIAGVFQNKPLMIGGLPVVISTGINSGDNAYRFDHTGLRIATNASANTTATAMLDVNGTFKLTDGTQVNGYVLTSNASGNASWAAPSPATYTASVTIPTASVLTLGTVAYTITPDAPIGKAIEVISASACITSYGGTPYATNTTLQLISGGADIAQMTDNSLLISTVPKIIRFRDDVNNPTATQTQILTAGPLQAKVQVGNPTAGNSDIKINVLYRIVSF